MIKPIMKSEFFLRLPSEDAGPDDAATGQDLLDTLHEHERECVGLAANMIGVRKRIICVKDGNRTLLMYNPQILEQVNAYQTSEGCLLVPPFYRTADHLTLRVPHSRQSDVQFRGRDQKVSALSFHVTLA